MPSTAVDPIENRRTGRRETLEGSAEVEHPHLALTMLDLDVTSTVALFTEKTNEYGLYPFKRLWKERA